ERAWRPVLQQKIVNDVVHFKEKAPQMSAAEVINLDFLESEAAHFKDQFSEARAAIGRVIVGQTRTVEAALTAIMCGGNVLLEGVPGLGKTDLVKALSRVLDLEFRRVQFTPDLMPADIVGTNVMSTDENNHYRF